MAVITKLLFIVCFFAFRRSYIQMYHTLTYCERVQHRKRSLHVMSKVSTGFSCTSCMTKRRQKLSRGKQPGRFRIRGGNTCLTWPPRKKQRLGACAAPSETPVAVSLQTIRTKGAGSFGQPRVGVWQDSQLEDHLFSMYAKYWIQTLIALVGLL